MRGSRNNAPKKLDPLQPDLAPWQGLTIIDTLSERFFGLEDTRMIPMGAFAATSFGMYKQSDWPAFASIVVIYLAWIWVFGRKREEQVVHATSKEEHTHDPP